LRLGKARVGHSPLRLGDTAVPNYAEQRLSPRRNVMIPAKIVFDGGRRRVDCIIRNLSDGGAKLEVPSVGGLPNTFDLIVPSLRPHGCRVAWRALREVGVQFIS
jgi:hypothetical protein